MTPDQELMQRVVKICSPLWDAISPPDNPVTSVPRAFGLALTAGETGAWLINNAIVPPRFENAVYEHLAAVQAGREANYGSITTSMLARLPLDTVLHDFATSWSLTQIMGYNVLVWDGWTLADVQNPATHYKATLKMLAQFCQRFGLDPTRDFESMATCWNGGHPGAKTVPPEYAQNVINRMQFA